MSTILVAESPGPEAAALRDGLVYEGYSATVVADGNEALARVEAERPDLAIIDVSLPGMGGLEVCGRLRRAGARTPIILLSAGGGEVERIRGLRSGADDVVAKPFSFLELLARVEAVLRRYAPAEEERRTTDGGLTLDPGSLRASRDGRDLGLTPREFRILHFLARHRDVVVSREQLLAAVWGSRSKAGERTVDVTIARLRRKLGDGRGRSVIATIHGEGYRFASGRG
jgi:DNA-binding response OmpR family regulator